MAAKSEATRERVLEVALAMFRDIGFEKTTMRAIAAEAGISVGNAYYYFASKDDLVQELYRQIQVEHAQRSQCALTQLGAEKSLAARLRTVLHAGIDVLEPYHAFGGEFITTAIRPSSSVNPFGSGAQEARNTAVETFRAVTENASPSVAKKFREDLPELLWLGYMGLTLFWVYDRSENQRGTRRLIDGAAPLLAKLVGLAKIPGVSKVFDQVLALRRSVTEPREGTK